MMLRITIASAKRMFDNCGYRYRTFETNRNVIDSIKRFENFSAWYQRSVLEKWENYNCNFHLGV